MKNSLVCDILRKMNKEVSKKMEHKNITYLVDLENIGIKALCHQIENDSESDYIVFHSDATSSPGSILEQVPDTLKISFVDCRKGGNNAMDFCISAMAGCLSLTTGQHIVILSDDKGYDPVLYMLHQKGVRITRQGTGSKQSDDVKDRGWRENVPIIKAIRESVPKKYQEDVIAVLPSAVSRAQAHEILQSVLPEKMVADVYRKLKKHIPKERT